MARRKRKSRAGAAWKAATRGGVVDLSGWAYGLQALADGWAEAAAPAVAKVVERLLRESVAAGVSPSGVPWAPRKADGKTPKLGRKITVTVEGDSVRIVLGGASSLHHWGIAKGRTFRRVIPTTSVPAAWRKPIIQACEDVAKGLAGG